MSNPLDPGVEELAALLQRYPASDEQIAEKIGGTRQHKMSASTVRNIRELKTTRPQNYTLTWIGWALGKRRVWTDI